jgi:hypothetical protein
MVYASYAIVNLSRWAGGNLTLDVATAQYRGINASVAIQGSLPVAGTYGPNSSVPLANQSAALAIHLGILDVARAFLNYSTGANGSLWLQDEHLQYARAVNLSLVASNFPNVTAGANGSYTLKYVTGAVAAQGFMGIDLSGRFSPGLQLVRAPLSNTSHWQSVSDVTWNGTVAYASALQATAPGGTTVLTSQAARTHLVRHDHLTLNATVNGTRAIHLPNGTLQTDYIVEYTLSSAGGGAQVVDGLYVVPSTNSTTTSTGLVAAVPEHPATAPLAPAAGPKTRAMVPQSHTLPTGAESTPAPGQTVTAIPMSPAAAHSAMVHLGTPSTPKLASSNGNFGLALIASVGAVAAGAVLVRREMQRRP